VPDDASSTLTLVTHWVFFQKWPEEKKIIICTLYFIILSTKYIKIWLMSVKDIASQSNVVTEHD